MATYNVGLRLCIKWRVLLSGLTILARTNFEVLENIAGETRYAFASTLIKESFHFLHVQCYALKFNRITKTECFAHVRKIRKCSSTAPSIFWEVRQTQSRTVKHNNVHDTQILKWFWIDSLNFNTITWTVDIYDFKCLRIDSLDTC